MTDNRRLRAEIARIEPRLIADRRHWHAHPELGTEERDTAAFVSARLHELGYEVRTGVADTGVVGTPRGRAAGRLGRRMRRPWTLAF